MSRSKPTKQLSASAISMLAEHEKVARPMLRSISDARDELKKRGFLKIYHSLGGGAGRGKSFCYDITPAGRDFLKDRAALTETTETPS